jgi:Carboxypeptidase regulatory-like domain
LSNQAPRKTLPTLVVALALATIGSLLVPAVGLAAGTGTIEGWAIDATSKAGIEGVEVCAYEVPTIEFQACEETDAAGEYTLSGLPPASYKVAFWGNFNGLNYLSQFYASKSSFETANVVTVVADDTVEDVGAAMHEGGQISGTVIDASSDDPIEGLWACAVEVPEFESEGCGQTNGSGEYTIGGLSTGSYVVEFWGQEEGLNYQTQYFDGESSFEEADEVSVLIGAVTPDVDAELLPGGRIKGRVTDAFGGAAIEDVAVCAQGTTSFGACVVTNENGEYTLSGLATGSYAVEFWAEHLGYEVEYYDDKSSFELANLISVTAPATLSGIDGHLGDAPGVVIPRLPVAPGRVAPNTIPPTVFHAPGPRCRKGFRKIKRRGRKVCVKAKKHRRKHSSAQAKRPQS